jgi:phosphoribosyl 1,2-cyclic phosphate phosphodiesterase
LRLRFLGTGTSFGIPLVGCGCDVCTSRDPRDRRTRHAALIESDDGTRRVLIDTPPELRLQLLAAQVASIDAVWFTHDHADHTHGIDDLRVLAIFKRRLVDVHADAATADLLRLRFGYCFETPPGSQYPPILALHRIGAGQPVSIAGAGGVVTALPFLQHHGDIDALGFRFGRMAYSSDVNGLPDESLPALEDLDLWIVDALRPQPHPSHWSLEETLAWIDRLKPRRAILTNMHTDLDYETLRRSLPEHVEPAFDGMTLAIAEEAVDR